MAIPLRNDRVLARASNISASSAETPSIAAETDYRRPTGGPVGQIQADLAFWLAGGLGSADVALAPDERLVRRVSVAGGYVAIVGAYLGVAMLFLR